MGNIEEIQKTSMTTEAAHKNLQAMARETARSVDMTSPAKEGGRKETRRRKLSMQREAGELAETLRDRDRGGDRDYEPDEFLVPTRSDAAIPGSNTDGASAHVKTVIMPEMDRCCSIILESRQFPYDTKSDLLRHALLEHLRRLAHMAPGVRSVLGQVDVMMRRLKDVEYQIRFDKLFDQAKIDYTELRRMGEQDQLDEEIDTMRKAIEAMPPGRWKVRFQRRFDIEVAMFRALKD